MQFLQKVPQMTAKLSKKQNCPNFDVFGDFVQNDNFRPQSFTPYVMIQFYTLLTVPTEITAHTITRINAVDE